MTYKPYVQEGGSLYRNSQFRFPALHPNWVPGERHNVQVAKVRVEWAVQRSSVCGGNGLTPEGGEENVRPVSVVRVPRSVVRGWHCGSFTASLCWSPCR